MPDLPLLRAFFVDNDDELRERYIHNVTGSVRRHCQIDLRFDEASSIEDAHDCLDRAADAPYGLALCDLLFPPLEQPDAASELHVPRGLEIVDRLGEMGCPAIIAFSVGQLESYPTLHEDALSRGAHLSFYRGKLQDPQRYGFQGLASDICRLLKLDIGERSHPREPGSLRHVSQYFLEVRMGDTYNVEQGGAVGRHAHAENFTQNRLDLSSPDQIEALRAELAMLREAMSAEAQSPEEYVALGEVAAAELAAASGDEQETVGRLKRAGRFAYEVAGRVGAAIAARVIAGELGY